MLLPSAMPCDRSTQGMVSPPASPPKLSSPATFHIISSCFPLQSLVASATESQQQQQQQQQQDQQQQQPHNHEQQYQQNSYFGGALLPQPLPTPPMAHTPSPMKLRLRTRSNVHDEAKPAGIVKRVTPPRHKRTLSATSNTTTTSSSDRDTTPKPPTTPKRSRIAPERIPRGLARADFHSLYAESQPVQQHNNGGCDGDSDWTIEDDRLLVELVLEKLKLSKADWQDCARTLGRDRHALTRRWKSLVLDDDVGLKRHKIPATWR